MASSATSKVYEQSEVGPLRWMAPESLLKSEYSTKSDVYAFGVTILEIITRQRPFHQYSNEELAEKVSLGQLDVASHVPEEISPDIRMLIIACCNKFSAMRPNFNEIVGTLENPNFKL